MGAGIAVMFKQKFKGVEVLKEQSESIILFKINMEGKCFSLGVLISRQSFWSAQKKLVLIFQKNYFILHYLTISHIKHIFHKWI